MPTNGGPASVIGPVSTNAQADARLITADKARRIAIGPRTNVFTMHPGFKPFGPR